MSWHALFNDGTRLNQFNDSGVDITFQKVLDRLSDLRALSICLDEKLCTVSLSDGMFTVDGRHVYILDTDIYPPEQLENIRPIYFEREQADFNAASGKPLGQKLLFTAIGFQALFNGRNVKRYLEVYSSGDYKVREK